VETHYIIYITKNLLNNKIYIGQHRTTDINDNYPGSGTKLREDMSIYGISVFERKILYDFDNEKEMNEMEAKLVNAEFVERNDTYNLAIGGNGGTYGVSDSKKEEINNSKEVKEHFKATKEHISISSALHECMLVTLKYGVRGYTHDELKNIVKRMCPYWCDDSDLDMHNNYNPRWDHIFRTVKSKLKNSEQIVVYDGLIFYMPNKYGY